MPASWGIVMTVDEPSDLVLANVAWHLGTGASEVHVFLDRPDDPLAPILAAIPGCRVTQCDADYWQAKPGKSRPELQIRRQTVNANRALAKATVDWLVHLDADEFLWQARPLAEEMAALTGLSAELTFSVAERCYRREGAAVVAPDEAPFAGVFRRASQGKPGFDRALYGTMEPLLQNGMLGHAAGKCAVPVGEDFVFAIHWSFRGFRDKANRSVQFPSTSTVLLHFDGLTPLHWAAKLRRYGAHRPEALTGLMSAHRRAQVARVQQTGDRLADVLRLHAELQGMAPATERRLRALGLVEDHAFDPRGVAAAVLPGWEPDLTVTGFDRALAGRYPEICAF